MKIFKFETQQLIPASIDVVWDFFSNPRNLKIITPPYMRFDILNEIPDEMEEGMIIIYTVSPLFNIPMRWVTEITYVEPKVFFVDEQRFGPYKFWHHKHKFFPVEGGTLMIDLVHYMLPVPLIDGILNKLLIAPRIREIFEFRRNKIKEIFGEK
ncbi:MAG: SRPBCC family protein [Candidatus Kryptonium sp.]|nr:SRPBCC family protein [Candidatus Kryptonium sp.]MCX7761485.1 SRPBCC family protein [Candidatus Kryptonium sp.]MDW8109527.1 SRPBCC family protein [Candidatus Kryptonium sp.]